jgi:hypothetical protein
MKTTDEKATGEKKGNRAGQRKISPLVLRALGFVDEWPGGNPKEPWWEHPDNGDLPTFFKRPTLDEFWAAVGNAFKAEGRLQLRGEIRKLIKTVIG